MLKALLPLTTMCPTLPFTKVTAVREWGAHLCRIRSRREKDGHVGDPNSRQRAATLYGRRVIRAVCRIRGDKQVPHVRRIDHHTRRGLPSIPRNISHLARREKRPVM
jgi:hypothetical protein